ncbi:pentatricopeptide repeat-containing protein At4g02750-like [Selaginella moellendorffii]|nr:pentatricopeptide repeat-containing protein At4g02750-like [Selaginella moellendorffii]|eukprot:XP_024520071.1 pentatricopeptide repeat-containing protein At4g02750-like [Selaginella moellendorffii]
MEKRNLLTWTAIVTALAQRGHLDKAKSFFDRMPQRSLIAWNAVIVGYCREPERLDEARELFDAMPERDCVSCNAMIGIYGDRGDIAQARTIFSQFRGEESVSLSTAMVVAYSHNGHLLEARNVFDRALEKDIVLWNAMLCGYAHNSCLDQARSFLSIMPEYNTATWNILITANARERDVSLAREVFDKMPVEKNVVTWNALLGALSQNGLCQEALRLFRLMDLEGMPLNEVTLVTALDSCVEIEDARILHDCINGKGYGCSVLLGNALVSLYSRCGSLEDVKCAFDSMPTHSISSWNTMIVAYSRNGHIDLAKTMFQQMPQRNILSLNSMVSAYTQNGHSDLAIELKSSQFDEVTLAALVDACASLSDPLEGRLIHREAVTAGLQSDLTVRNSLINMYGKCGSVREAATVMETMTCRDVLTWNAMLTAYCQNSMIPSGLEMLLVMRMEGIEPDTATHSILLSAFSHAGMVEDACAYVAGFAGHLDSDHYMCVVDLLGRAGILDMAWMLIQKAPRQKGDDPLLPWTTLLAACRMHGDGNTGLNAAKNAISLKPCKSSPYILASSTMW